MSGACLVGRTELLAWLNELCATELTRVEQARSALACQVLDALYPGEIPISRVDWSATQPYECMHNYKLLQQSFSALKINKQIPVDKLVRGKYQDKLEFLQWLKAFYDRHKSPQKRYDAVARRSEEKGGAQYNSKPGVAANPLLKKRTKASRHMNQRCSVGDVDDKEVTDVLEKLEDMKIKTDELEREKETLVKQIGELRANVGRLEEERDFYYKKLQDIEELVHDAELSKTTSAQTNLLGLSILDVLFATEDEDQELPF
ncbi:hypothetical protein V7S43_004185 [Phytophthora oleae]|uniref:Uncharacterized protein n=1 Tax=Phytophthora oleae TaxID=2107226 RepID=A0ABD3FX50_9STRA